MNLRTRLKRASIAAVAVLVIFGAGAFAETSTTTSVTATVVAGERDLVLTGVDTSGTNPLPTGPANLSFGPNTTEAAFGVLVSDIAYDRVGYTVDATLTNLYKLKTDGTGYDCSTMIPSGAFSVSFVDFGLLTTSGISAYVKPGLTFVDDINNDLSSLLGETITLAESTVTPTVEGLVDDLTTSLELMTTGNGTEGTSFSGAAAHVGCGGAASSVSPVDLQTGSPASPDLSGLTDQVFESADGVATSDGTDSDNDILTETESVSGGLLPQDALDPATPDDPLTSTDERQPGGVLWEATRDAIIQQLSDTIYSTLSTAELDTLTTDVVADLTLDKDINTVAELVLELIGQTGVYKNVPELVADDTQFPASSGLYHGTMTVTLTDQP